MAYIDNQSVDNNNDFSMCIKSDEKRTYISQLACKNPARYQLKEVLETTGSFSNGSVNFVLAYKAAEHAKQVT